MMKLMCSILALAAISNVAAAQVPQSRHVVMVVEENHSYSQVVGNSSMPYLNSLAQKYGLAVNYYGNTHPSIGNYFMLTTGQIITNNDGYTGTVTANNIVRAALTSGVTWKSYAESLPSVGYIGGDKYPYSKHHNPFAYFSDVVNSSTEKNNIVPFTRFAQDLANHTLPTFSFVIPNLNNDMHDCPAGMSSCTDAQKAAAADAWLKKNIAPLLTNSDFQNDGLLIITWDEGRSSDTAHGGGHVATVMIGPKVRRGYRSSTFYQEQSLLRTVVNAVGMTVPGPGASASAAPMSDFFTLDSGSAFCAMSTVSPSVTICSPTDNATTSSPIHVQAVTTSSSTVNYMAIWLDGVKKLEIAADKLDTYLAASAGTHRLTVQAKDTSGALFAKTIYVTVP
jgi:phosphatidylinositol-3-phosphatase